MIKARGRGHFSGRVKCRREALHYFSRETRCVDGAEFSVLLNSEGDAHFSTFFSSEVLPPAEEAAASNQWTVCRRETGSAGTQKVKSSLQQRGRKKFFPVIRERRGRGGKGTTFEAPPRFTLDLCLSTFPPPSLLLLLLRLVAFQRSREGFHQIIIVFHKLKIICKRKSFSLKFPSFGSIVESLSSEEDKLVSKEGGETSDVRHQSEAAAAANLLFCSVGDEERRKKIVCKHRFLPPPFLLVFSSRMKLAPRRALLLPS